LCVPCGHLFSCLVGPVLSRNRNWLGPIWSSPSLWGKVSSNVEIPLVSTPCLYSLSISATSQHPGSKPQISTKAEQNTRGVLCYPSSTSWLQNGETSRRRCQGLVPSPVDESSGGWIGQAEHGPIWSSPCFCKTLASPDMENTSQVSCLGLFRLPRVFATHYWQCSVSAVKLQQNATFPLKSL